MFVFFNLYLSQKREPSQFHWDVLSTFQALASNIHWYMHKNKNTLTIIILCSRKKNLENTTYMHTYSKCPDQRSDLCFELWNRFSFWFVLWYASPAGGPRTDRCVFTHHVQSTEFATDGVRLKASRRWLGSEKVCQCSHEVFLYREFYGFWH